MRKLLLFILLLIPNWVFGATPVLYFTDLINGPKSGWEESATKGAAVTVWGQNFGASRGSSTMTVCGETLNSAGDFAEWGVTTNNARSMERITFYLNSSMDDGAGTIQVTTSEGSSNTLPFFIRASDIYFIDRDTGSNAYNGLYSTFVSGSDGPWLNAYMSNGHNSAVGTGDITYIRASASPYVTSDPGGLSYGGIIGLDNDSGNAPSGTANNHIGIVGYPGEWPQIGTSSQAAAIRNDKYGVPQIKYYVFAKMIFKTTTSAINFTNADHMRVIGNHIVESTNDALTGALYFENVQDFDMYGNYFNNLIEGADGHYKHDVYITAINASKGEENETENIYFGYNELDTTTALDDSQGTPSMEVKTSTQSQVNRSINVFIFNNYWHDGDGEAIRISFKVQDIYIYNNIFENMGDKSGGSYYTMNCRIRVGTAPDPDGNVYFYNNTLYGGYYRRIVHVQDISNLYSKNNIYVVMPGGTGPYIANDGTGHVYSDYDVYYGDGEPPSAGDFTVTNAINLDPDFVSAGTSDFTLSPGSPALDSGTSAVSGTVTDDYIGISRPQNSVYDIGSYEDEGAGITTISGSVSGSRG